MSESFAAPTCPKCAGQTKVKSNYNETRTYDLIRSRQCNECGHRFYTRQPREQLLPLEQIAWHKNGRNARLVTVGKFRK